MAQIESSPTSRSLYPGKSKRVQGILSADGGTLFERVRTALSHATDRDSISDGDVIDFAVRSTKLSTPVAFDGLVDRGLATERNAGRALRDLSKSK